MMRLHGRHSIVLPLLWAAIWTTSQAKRNCAILRNEPIIDYDLSYNQLQRSSIKFIGVKGTVYRNSVKFGEKPRIRILRYSTHPVITATKDELIISSKTCTSSLTGDDTESSGGSSIVSGTMDTSLYVLVATSMTFVSLSNSAMGIWSAILLMGLFTPAINAESEGETCTEHMEVVVEAPPYYLGSVEECRTEVGEETGHCPNDFPTFPSCEDTLSEADHSCALAVVGAGTGGLYTAMRLLDEGVFKPKEVCIFESTDRVGGRIYSLRGFGPENDITVDAGAYRTWPEFTPTTHALITDYLGLSVECYEDEDPCQKYNIINPETKQKIGFATFVEEMMRKLVKAGVCWYPRHELVSFDSDSTSNTKLYFANGATVSATSDVLLNVPQRPLLKILRKSKVAFMDSKYIKKIYDSLHSVQTEIGTKLYLYYSDAWWYELGLTNGDFEMDGDARNMLLKGRYHDGHVKCDENGRNCHGFLLAVYAHDHSGQQAQFFRRYQRDRPEPVTILSNTDVEGAAFLEHAHERLKEYHVYRDTSENKTYTGHQVTRLFDASKPPEYAVLATWNIGTFGAGGAWHHWTDLDGIDTAMSPLCNERIHVVNEAYSTLQGWAEGSLLAADAVLEEQFGVKRPWNFDAPDYVQFVAQTESQRCDDAESSTESNGGGGGGSGGSDGVVDLCFTEDALVTMADGTSIPISKVKTGDLVDTGMDGVGKVTKVLKHAVKEEVEVVVVVTDGGSELVGTPSHPVYVNEEWVELAVSVEKGLFTSARTETRFVEFFYNLEIDGHVPGQSSHSFVAHGTIVSGLGDDELLNKMYQRQRRWKVKKAALVA